MQIQQEIEQLNTMNRLLRDRNQQLEKSMEMNQEYMDMAVKLKAIEYIIKTESYSIRSEVLASVLGISLPKVGDS